MLPISYDSAKKNPLNLYLCFSQHILLQGARPLLMVNRREDTVPHRLRVGTDSHTLGTVTRLKCNSSLTLWWCREGGRLWWNSGRGGKGCCCPRAECHLVRRVSFRFQPFRIFCRLLFKFSDSTKFLIRTNLFLKSSNFMQSSFKFNCYLFLKFVWTVTSALFL